MYNLNNPLCIVTLSLFEMYVLSEVRRVSRSRIMEHNLFFISICFIGYFYSRSFFSGLKRADSLRRRGRENRPSTRERSAKSKFHCSVHKRERLAAGLNSQMRATRNSLGRGRYLIEIDASLRSYIHYSASKTD